MQEVKDVTAFGCCAFWQSCKLGSETCVYAISNPAKQQACGVYKRAKRARSCNFLHETTEAVHPSQPMIEINNFDSDEDGQLTLF
ncbi:hypothetical protein ACOMCU_22575 [Lysinibacillus sp. UGB7]|uniref:hypothetical protein n=1 Tax=Lysinibacillus sp. UGB7 TaxID=3411039 RepID=UPI003B7D40F5